MSKKMELEEGYDLKLMVAYLNGDENAFIEIYNKYSGKVYHCLLKRCRNEEETQELFQKVFMKFHQSREKYDPKYPLMQWIYVISKSVFFDYCRAQKREVEIEDLKEEQFLNLKKDNIEENEQKFSDQNLDQLSEDQRSVLHLKVIEELSYEEISKKLNRTESTIRKIYSRAINKLSFKEVSMKSSVSIQRSKK